LPFFEYFVVLDGGATLLFDTHHNTLVISRSDPFGVADGIDPYQ
jgi:hypothetical protein